MNNEIKLSEFDFVRISKLLMFSQNMMLQHKIGQAEIVKGIMVPPDLVTVDSIIVYELDNRIAESTLVFPRVPDEQQACVSVLDEIGTALIGLSENQETRWLFSDGEKDVRILDIVYQPEAMGDLHPLI